VSLQSGNIHWLDTRSIDKRNCDGMAAATAAAAAAAAAAASTATFHVRQRREQTAEGSKWASKFHDNSYK